MQQKRLNYSLIASKRLLTIRNNQRFLVFLSTILSVCLASVCAQAKLTGPCSNCHTMHNSQDGLSTVNSGTGTTLLFEDCIGCHSSDTDQTIISGTPIVFNTVPPTNPLAGGNFYWVSQGGAANDVFGHNVWGVTGVDNNIDPVTVGAPGNGGFTCGTSCHASLATDPALNADFGDGPKGGCQGCHYEVAHHDDSKPWFRFLKGHIAVSAYVEGIEAPTWEQNAVTNPADRNIYKGTNATYTWGNGLGAEHPAPAVLAVPRGTDIGDHDGLVLRIPGRERRGVLLIYVGHCQARVQRPYRLKTFGFKNRSRLRAFRLDVVVRPIEGLYMQIVTHGQPDLVGTGNALGNLQVYHLRQQNSNDNGQLINRDKPAAHGGRRYLGDVHGREVGGQADPHTPDPAVEVEPGKAFGKAGAQCREGEREPGKDEQAFAPESVTENARGQGTE